MVNSDTYTPQCPFCLSRTHDANHLFNCSQVPTQQNTTSLWKKPAKAAEVIQEWESRLATLGAKRSLLQILGEGTTNNNKLIAALIQSKFVADLS